MSELDDSIVDEFLVDSHEGLDQLDRDLVELEKDPACEPVLARAFRTLHTIKGTCSFLGFRRLERVAHAGESLLARLRARELALDPEITSALLAVVDVVRQILAAIESTRREPDGDDAGLLARLERWGAVAKPRRAAAPPAVSAPAPAATGADAAESAAASETELQSHHVRLDVKLLDRVMNLVGELVLARNQMLQIVAREDWGEMPAAAQRTDLVTTRLQEAVMGTRMQPVSTLWTRLPRMVRDVAAACGKRVRLEMEGTNTELDKTLVEALKDPLTHLVRNAVDHGIEAPEARAAAGKPAEGVLRLRAYHEGGQVHLELSDDGAGMDVDRIRERALERGLVTPEESAHFGRREWLALVFLPGFSTATRVTSVSGRGVGMDVVQASVERVGGSIELDSHPGLGTTVRLRIPLTLAIIPALMVEDGGERYAIPQANLVELVRPAGGELAPRIEHVHDAPVYRLRGELVPLVFLARELRGPDATSGARPCLVVLSADGRRFGLIVDGVRDTEEIVVKALSSRLHDIGPFAGATIRGDGRVAVILDVPALARRAGLRPASAADAPALEAPAPPAGGATLLLVTVRPGVRAAVPLAGVSRIEEFPGWAFERLDERPCVPHRGEALPIAPLADIVSPGAWRPFTEERAWPVLVHERGGLRFGLLVDSVDDVLELDRPAHPGERVVLRDSITDVVDLAEAARAAFPDAAGRAG